MSNRDAWIRRLTEEEEGLVRQVEILGAKLNESQDRRGWLQCPHRYGDIVAVQRVSCRVVVVVPGADRFIGAVLRDSEITPSTETVYYSEPHEYVGPYTGPDLPPKPPEAEWAEKVLDGEILAPLKMCRLCGCDHDPPKGVFCTCERCEDCNAPISEEDWNDYGTCERCRSDNEQD